jgi:nucleotide-binding universal stress UspA family protein
MPAYGISLGKAWEAEITAIHVIEPGHALPDGGAEAKGQAREEESRRQAEDLLNKIDILAKKEGVNIKKEALEESDIVGKAIIDYAKKNNVDVIVIGTRGMTAVQEYFWKRCQQSHSPCTLSSICNPLIHWGLTKRSVINIRRPIIAY